MNKSWHYLVDNSQKWLGVHMVFDQWFEYTLKSATSLRCLGSFGNQAEK